MGGVIVWNEKGEGGYIIGVTGGTGENVNTGAGEEGNAGELSDPAADAGTAETVPVGAPTMVGAAEAASDDERAATLVGGGIDVPPPPAETRRRNGGGVESGGSGADKGERKRAARLAGT